MRFLKVKCAVQALLVASCLLSPTPAAIADPQSKSWSHWQIAPDSRVSGLFSITNREASRLANDTRDSALAAAWRDHLVHAARLSAKGADCQLHEATSVAAAQDYQRARLDWRCGKTPETLELTLPVLAGATSGHVHFATLVGPDGSTTERLFTYGQPSHTVHLRDPSATDRIFYGWTDVLPSYIGFGFDHILIGIDHIAFLLALMLLSGKWRSLLWIITGFTLGHSITLSLAALNLVDPRVGLVETLIGLTIAITAVENVVCRNGLHRGAAFLFAVTLLGLALADFVGKATAPPLILPGLALFCFCYFMLSDSESRALRLRPTITVLFGLVHGFGFASVLLEVGLPDTAQVPALLGFNIGVELGQIAVVGTLGLLAWPLRKFRPEWAVSGAQGLSAALCGLGVFWFVQRLYF